MRREQERSEEEEGICREVEMETGKEEHMEKVNFEVGQSSRGSNRGRPSRRGKGRRRRGRGRPRQAERCETEAPVSNQQKIGCRSIEQITQEAERAYNTKTNEEIRKIIDALEDKVLEEVSDPEMEEWNTLLPDPGNTRGSLSLYKRTLHMYWVVKHLLAKAMEQVAEEMMEMVQGPLNLKREMNNLQFMIQKQDSRMEEIRGMLKKITTTQHGEEIKQVFMVD